MARILIIDDDQSFRSMLRETLEGMGHNVFEGVDGLDGLSVLLREDSIDVVFTDLIMPEKDGLELIPEVRRLCPEVKIIVISGGGGRMNRTNLLDMAKQLGADQTLAKPFLFQELMAVLKAALPS